MDRHMTLADKLVAAKEKAALRDFEVTITETLEKKVTIRARDRLEAEMIAQGEWDDSKHILDADNFTGVRFDAAPMKPELARGGKGKGDNAL